MIKFTEDDSLTKINKVVKEIAKTSVTPIKDKRGRGLKIDAAYSWIKPYTPVMHVIDSRDKELDERRKTLDEYKELGLEDVVILTQGGLEYSSLNGHLIESTKDDPYDYYKHNRKKYRVATCITFKGLEADAIILLNLNSKSF